MTTMLDAALELAAAGWKVHPCRESDPGGKSPYLKHGHLDATSDPDEIRALWTVYPDALIGGCVPSGLMVIDLDPRNVVDQPAVDAFMATLPETLICWSGRDDGGHHRYYLRPPGTLTSTRLPKGVDLKANGYAILPPSLHPVTGLPYRWEIHPIAPAPLTLRESLRVSPPRPFTGGSGDGSPLTRLVSGLTAGERNRGLYWAACRAAETGILPQLEGDLISAAISAGLPEQEARRVISSASRTAGRSR